MRSWWLRSQRLNWSTVFERRRSREERLGELESLRAKD